LLDIITVDLVEHSTSVIDDFCVVSRVLVTVPVRPLKYMTWGNAFYHIFEAGDGVTLRPIHATVTTDYPSEVRSYTPFRGKGLSFRRKC